MLCRQYQSVRPEAPSGTSKKVSVKKRVGTTSSTTCGAWLKPKLTTVPDRMGVNPGGVVPDEARHKRALLRNSWLILTTIFHSGSYKYRDWCENCISAVHGSAGEVRAATISRTDLHVVQCAHTTGFVNALDSFILQLPVG